MSVAEFYFMTNWSCSLTNWAQLKSSLGGASKHVRDKGPSPGAFAGGMMTAGEGAAAGDGAGDVPGGHLLQEDAQ